jgi:hypothetical protein
MSRLRISVSGVSIEACEVPRTEAKVLFRTAPWLSACSCSVNGARLVGLLPGSGDSMPIGFLFQVNQGSCVIVMVTDSLPASWLS